MHFKLEMYCIPCYFLVFFFIQYFTSKEALLLKWKQRHNQSTSVKSKLLQGTYKYKVDILSLFGLEIIFGWKGTNASI